MVSPFELVWKLPQTLESHGLSAYKLEQQLVGKVSRTTVYRYVREVPGGVNLETIGWMLWALEELTGKSFELTDILEYTRTAEER
jgi:hypothetical protein